LAPFAFVFPNALISDILPLTTANFTSFNNLFAVSVLSLDAPTPTGSSITGIFCSFAFFPALIIDSMVLEFNVPIFITNELLMDTISSTSSISSAIIGEPPQANNIFAQSFTVT